MGIDAELKQREATAKEATAGLAHRLEQTLLTELLPRPGGRLFEPVTSLWVQPAVTRYGFYYWGFLLLGIWESIEKLEGLKPRSRARSLLQWYIIGYLSFMAPMGAAYVVFPETRNAVASVMCGFAIVLAFILTFKIVPAYDRLHAKR